MDIQRGNIMLWLAISIIILSTGLLSHVMALPIILNVAGRDAWISVVIAAPLFIGWLMIYTKIIHSMNNVPFTEWSKQHWGVIPSWITKLILASILFFNGMYALLDTMTWTVNTYLVQTPLTVITICAVVTAIAIAMAGIQSIGVIASILLPVVSFLGYFVKFSNKKHKDFSLLLPAFEHGYFPPILGSMYVLSSLLDIWIIILYAHHVKKKITMLQVVLLCLFMLALVIGPLSGSISEFGALEATKQRYPAFEQWKILSLGQFLQHVDFLSIYQWLAGAIIRITISLYLLVDLFNIKKNRTRGIWIAITGLTMMAMLYLPWREDIMLNMLQHIYFPTILIFVLLLTTITGITAIVIRNKKEDKRNE